MLFDTNMHGVSARALGYIGPVAKPVLLSALTNSIPQIRGDAIEGLTCTEMALASAADVRSLVHDSDVRVAMVASSRSMAWLPAPQGLEVGIEALRDSRPFVLEYALRCLQQNVKTNRTLALPAIIPLLESPDARVRETATNVFREISSPAEVRKGRQ
jgi:HEAT repeat protein